MEKTLFDAVIIGGGPAGLSAALVLGRARKNILVIDEGRPRNRVTHESHGFLTRDRIAPAELRAIAVEQVSAYPSVHFAQDSVVDVSGSDLDFQVKTAEGETYLAKKLLFAAGKKDGPIEIDGLLEAYGKSAFVCPYCDGWEMRDRPLALIAKGAGAVHFAKVVSGWSADLAILTDGPDGLTGEQREELKRHGIPVYAASIRKIVSEEGQVSEVQLADGQNVACTGIFFAPKLVPGTDLPGKLGCSISETGTVVVDAFGKTSVAGVYGAGDAATEMYQIAHAVSMGSFAAVGINTELNSEAWDRK